MRNHMGQGLAASAHAVSSTYFCCFHCSGCCHSATVPQLLPLMRPLVWILCACGMVSVYTSSRLPRGLGNVTHLWVTAATPATRLSTCWAEPVLKPANWQPWVAAHATQLFTHAICSTAEIA
jgi:hypothetical protein